MVYRVGAGIRRFALGGLLSALSRNPPEVEPVFGCIISLLRTGHRRLPETRSA